MPTSFSWLRLLRAPGHHCSPIGSDKIDVRTQLLQEINGDVAPRLVVR